MGGGGGGEEAVDGVHSSEVCLKWGGGGVRRSLRNLN